MDTHFLAFKGVTSKFKSAFVRGTLQRTYTVGKNMRSHPDFPFWLIQNYPTTDWNCFTGCDAYIDKFILVRVPRQCITQRVHFCSLAGGTYYDRYFASLTLKEILEHCQVESAIATTSLTVLEEVNTKKLKSAWAAKEYFKTKYKLPFIT